MTTQQEDLKHLLQASLARLEEQENRNPPPSLRLLPIGKAAQALSCSRGTIWRMVKEGRIRAVELRAGRRRIPESELVRIVEGGVA